VEDLKLETVGFPQLVEVLGEDVTKRLGEEFFGLGGEGLLWFCLFKGKDPKVLLAYEEGRSTIRKVLFLDGVDYGLLEFLLDRLLERESLVGAEVPLEDRELMRMLVSYGFRPFYELKRGDSPYLRLEMSAAVYFHKLPRLKPQVSPSKEKVVVKRVLGDSIPHIRRALEEVFSALGGLEKFLKPGQRVVLKPNVVAEHGMRQGAYVGGVVTDKRLIRALIELLLPLAGEVIVAEGSSINRSATTKMFEVYGFQELEEIDPKVKLCDLNVQETLEKPVPRAKRMSSRKVPRVLEEADLVISLPVMKTHFAAVVSLGVKNLQGCMPPLEKYMTHFFGLWQNLVNIHHLVRPRLTILDALVGQEGFGPVYGDPKPMGLIIAGENPVAVDSVAMRIMGLDPKDSPAVHLAYLQGLGPMDLEDIEVLGTPIEEVRSPFRLAEIDLSSGKCLQVHHQGACPGCRGYLHFVLYKLRRPDPKDPKALLIDRPFDPPVRVFIGPYAGNGLEPSPRDLFIGFCQAHNAHKGHFVPGCPPHAEAMMRAVFQFFPDVPRPTYADKTEEEKLERMLMEVLSGWKLPGDMPLAL